MFSIAKIKIVLVCLLVSLSLVATQLALAVPYSSSDPVGTSGLNDTAKKAFGEQVVTQNSDPTKIIGRIVGAALAFLGIIFFVLIIMGGYMWMTSMGNEQSTTKAKDILLAAVIGLFIVLIAYAAVKLVAGIFT